MINELYMLSKAMDEYGLEVQQWNRKYISIPNITSKAPCVRINISNNKVTSISEVNKELGKKLRKYGSKQGTYPCMNLAPLYRITNDDIKKEINKIKPEALNKEYIQKIRGWCIEDNWKERFKNKYRISMVNIPNQLKEIVNKYDPINILIEETYKFQDPIYMHDQLEQVVFKMLERCENIDLAFKVLFHYGDQKKDEMEDYGKLTIALESDRLINQGIAVVSERFVNEFNDALIASEIDDKNTTDNANNEDAFGMSFIPLNEPMPEVKLAGGFEAKLRSMFKEQKCQMRYNKIEDASYPISKRMRMKLQSALNWIGSTENEDKMWVNIDKNEILFVYPSHLSNECSSYTAIFKIPKDNTITFQKCSEILINDLKHGNDLSKNYNNVLQVFILRKVDNARTKVVYTRQTDVDELEVCCENWRNGFLNNLPKFAFGRIYVPYPIQIANILNKFWKQNGQIATDKFKPIPKYHGMELLFDADRYIKNDLHILVRNSVNIGSFLGTLSAKGDIDNDIWKKVRPMLALTGFLLYFCGSRKDEYMEKLPYIYGQLLKVSDELHVLYCRVVRENSIPPQLAGGNLFQAAIESPVRTLSILGQRMNPYILWAKSYGTKNIMDEGKESWRARWLLSLYERMATKIYDSLEEKISFSDTEKAQFFIGYLAAFPKNEKAEEKFVNKEEDNENE